MFCKKCGANLPEDVKFCEACGTPVAEEPILETTDAPTQEAAIPALSPKQQKKQQKREKRQIYIDAILNPKRMGAVPAVMLSILFGLFLFVITVVSSVGLTAQSTVRGDALFHEIYRLDLSDTPLSQIMPSGGLAGSDKKATLYDFLSKEMGLEQLTPSVIEKIVENSSIQAHLTEVLVQYGEYIVNGKVGKRITTKDVVEWMEESSDQIYEYAGIEMTEELLDWMSNELSENKEMIQLLNPSKTLGTNKLLTLVSIICSPVATVILLVLIVILLILHALCTRRICFTLMTASVVSFINGVVMLVIPWVLSLFVQETFLIELVLRAIADVRITCGLSCVLFGLLFLMLYVLIKCLAGLRRKSR